MKDAVEKAWGHRKKLLVVVLCASIASNLVILNLAWGRRQADLFNERVLRKTEVGNRKLAEAGIDKAGATKLLFEINRTMNSSTNFRRIRVNVSTTSKPNRTQTSQAQRINTTIQSINATSNSIQSQVGYIHKQLNSLSFDICNLKQLLSVPDKQNYANATHTQRDMQAFTDTLRTIIPPPNQFLEKYQSPCWYMQLSDRYSSLKILKQLSNISDEDATLTLNFLQFSTKQTLICLPKLFMIGFPRSGSTQLFEMLVQHPKVVPGLRKEVHWWTRTSFRTKFPHNVLAVLQYLSYFMSASSYIEKSHPTGLTVDASQSTVWDTRAFADPCIMPSLIHRVVPNAKYIVIMRDPAERLYSDFIYLQSRGEKSTSKVSSNISKLPYLFHNGVVKAMKQFESCIALYTLEVCTDSILDGSTSIATSVKVRLGVSMYYVHVAKWLRVIPRDQLLFLRTEDLALCPYAVLQRIWRFLGVPDQSPFDIASVLFKRSNGSKGNGGGMLEETRMILREFFEPFNEQLALVLNDVRFLWNDSVH